MSSKFRLPNILVRRRSERRTKNVLTVESLECRQLLAGDLAAAEDEPFPDIGSVHGTKWEDLNGNGLREDNETGLAGVTIYADLNRNGILDRGEPLTETMEDDPLTDFDESGMYWLEGLRPGEHSIREIVPDGFVQTFPRPSDAGGVDDGPVIDDGGPILDLFASVHPEFLDLHLDANEVEETQVSITIHPFCIRPYEIDVVASDPDIEFANGTGVVVNGCGGDTSTFDIKIAGDGESHRFDLLFLDRAFDGANVRPLATIPVTINGPITAGGHLVVVEPGAAVEGVDFGNQRVREPGSVHGTKWHDLNGNGERDADEPGLPGVVIYADLNRDGDLDRGEPATRSMRDDPDTDFDEGGMYWLDGLRPGEHVIRELVPDGFRQTFPSRSIVGPDVLVDNPITTVAPEFLNLQLAAGEVEGTEVSFTFHPVCIRAFEVDVVASDPTVQLTNATGVLTNGCGGDTNVFNLEFVGDGLPHRFDLLFVDAEFGGELASIPVTINATRQDGAHRVVVESGAAVEGIDFGNQLVDRSGSVHGRKWNDLNGNGIRDRNEPGLPGVTIYSDLNGNGVFDRGEPATRSMRDDPATDFDEGGTYWLEDLRPGEHVVREIVPDGFRQTFPARLVGPVDGGPDDGVDGGIDIEFGTIFPDFLDLHIEAGDILETEVGITIHPLCLVPFNLDVVSSDPNVEFINHTGPLLNGCGGDTSVFEVAFIGDGQPHDFDLVIVDAESGNEFGFIPVTINVNEPGGHVVVVEPGAAVEGIHFGNQPIRRGGGIEGRKWLDVNGNGEQDGNEPGLGGVNIYLDLNNNGAFDRGEPLTETQFDNPFTDFDEGGLYSFSEVTPGEYSVGEIEPEGFRQTFPGSRSAVLSSETGKFADGVAIDFDVTDVDYQIVATGDTSTSVELTVVWPDSCGSIITDLTSHAVIGNTILVDMHGEQVGNVCAEVISPESQEIEVRGLEPGRYNVVGTLHEKLDAGDLATLGVVSHIGLGGPGHHRVVVEAGETVSDVNFGNQPTGQGGSIHGIKWLDINGDGRQQDSEPGLAGVTIYLDLNRDGEFNRDEPHAISMRDNPDTRVDETGHYWLEDIRPGVHFVREVVPAGFSQTFPPEIVIDPLPGQGVPVQGRFHIVNVRPGEAVERINFGNQSDEPGSIHGVKWEDLNGNGQREDNEPGLPGVTIYIDSNFNGQLDDNEPHVISMRDDPDTARDEAGHYWLEGVKPGRHHVREVVPNGFAQTFPPSFILAADDPFFGPLPPLFDAPHVVHVIGGQALQGIDFGNQRIEPGSIHGVKWLDANGNGTREDDEPGLPGVTIYLDLNFSGQLDDNEPHTVTMRDDPTTARDEAGHYWLEGVRPGFYAVGEVVPDGFEQTFPIGFPIPLDGGLGPDEIIAPPPPGHHLVFLGSGSVVEGINFGNRRVEPAGAVAGVKWLDRNGNAERDAGEPGLPGVVIFADTNLNGQLDQGEPRTRSQRDNPETDFDEGGLYRLGLPAGDHLILEELPRGYEQIHPSPFRRVIFPYNLGHAVTVDAGETVEGVDFGNRPAEFSAIAAGAKWLDRNGNGLREDDEPGLPGITIFADVNLNGRFDDGEPAAITRRDNPDTRANEAGQYELELPVGTFLILEVLSPRFEQTHPNTAREIIFPFNLGHTVTFDEPRQRIDGLDFGNRPVTNNEVGAIAGVKWLDLNGNGSFDGDETGEPGVTVYLDLNNNSQLDRGEPSQLTGRDDPNTRFDESGRFAFNNLAPGEYVVREHLPEGFIQTFPIGGFVLDETFPVDLRGGAAIGFDLVNLATETTAAGEVGVAATFEVTWPSSCGHLLDQSEVSIDGNEIKVNLFGEFDFDAICLTVVTTEQTTVNLGPLDFGGYGIRGLLTETTPFGISVDSFAVAAKFIYEGDGAHFVELAAGETVDGINFGNLPVPRAPRPRADANGDDLVDANDVDMVAMAIRGPEADLDYDLNLDGELNRGDMDYLIHDVLGTNYGDANLDGVFDSSDLVLVFQAAGYEDDEQGNSGWSEGDWNGDGEFDSADLVFAFQHSDYENGTAARGAVLSSDLIDEVWSMDEKSRGSEAFIA